MWLMDFITSQKIDVIRWTDPEPYLLVKKFERWLDEIKDDAALIVWQGQAAIFVHNWKIEAIQTEGGKWSLKTDNIPFISSFKNILRWLETAEKAAVYFLNTTKILNQKWWTKNPVKYIDPVYKFPVKLRAFWNFTFEIGDIEKFWIGNIWERAEVPVDEIKQVIVDRILQLITDIFAESKLSYTDIDKNRMEIAAMITDQVNNEITSLWLTITDFRIEDTNFDEETEELINKVSQQTANVQSMNQLKDVDQWAMDNYKTTRQLDVMEKAAENEGSMWGMMWTVVGMNMWNNMWQSMSAGMQNNTQPNTNQPTDQQPWDSIEDKLVKLKDLFDKKLISEEEYNNKKSELLKSF